MSEAVDVYRRAAFMAREVGDESLALRYERLAEQEERRCADPGSTA